MMRSAGTDIRYTYAVARTRVLETRLLDDGAFETILEKEDLASTLRVLLEYSNYTALAEKLRDSDAVEGTLRAELAGTYALMHAMAEEKALVEPFLVKQDIIAKKGERDDYDRTIWAAFRSAWKNNAFLSGYLKIAIDLENIKIFFRAKARADGEKSLRESLLDGGTIQKSSFDELYDRAADEIFSRIGASRYSSIVAPHLEDYKTGKGLRGIEKACDDHLMGYIRAAKYFHFGAEPLVSYILARETELRNVKAILVGKFNRFKADEIRPALRKSYV